MSTIVTRAGKGAALSWTEADANFTNLNTDKYESGDSPTFAVVNLTTAVPNVQYAGVAVGGFYAPQTYSKYVAAGVTTNRTWGSALAPVFGFAAGTSGQTSLVNFNGSSSYLLHGAFIDSDLALKYTTAATTPAYVSLSGGQFTVGVAATSGAAGDPVAFTTPLKVYGSDQSVRVNEAIVGAVGGIPFRNRIQNGAMRIDQRNGGAAVTVNSSTVNNHYSVDRWYGGGTSAAGVFTLQQVTSTNPGFPYALKCTVTTSDASLAAGDLYYIAQRIEGQNVADLAYGTASARTATLSFWVKSSVTGTFSGSVANAGTRSYVFEYTVDSANTWEYKTVTLSGDTTGSWATSNAVGIQISFTFGGGSTYQGTASSWTAGNFFCSSGATNLMATLNATWEITGVQFEAGPVASPYEQRSIQDEIQNCLRYFETIYQPAFYVPGTTATLFYIPITYKVKKRSVSHTVTLPSATNAGYNASGGTITPTTWTAGAIYEDGFRLEVGHASGVGGIASMNTTPIKVFSEMT